MTTVRDSILAAIVVRLQAMTPTPASIKIEPTGDPDKFDAIEIYDGGDTLTEREAMLDRWSMDLTITGIVQGGGGTAPTAARNALDAHVVAALMADDTLGGLVEQIEAGDRRNSTAVLAEHRRLGFDREFTIQFTTQRRNPALPA